MKSRQEGSVILFVMLAVAIMSVWAAATMHCAGSILQAAIGRVVREEQICAADAIMTYTAAWCSVNRTLFNGDDKETIGVDGQPAIWQLTFYRVPVAGSICQAYARVTPHDGDRVSVVVDLQKGEQTIFSVRSVLTGIATEQRSLVVQEWNEYAANRHV